MTWRSAMLLSVLMALLVAAVMSAIFGYFLPNLPTLVFVVPLAVASAVCAAMAIAGLLGVGTASFYDDGVTALQFATASATLFLVGRRWRRRR